MRLIVAAAARSGATRVLSGDLNPGQVISDARPRTARRPVGDGFAPNGEVWIHNDGDGAVHVIESSTDTVAHTVKGLGQGTGRMAVSGDGRWATSTHGESQHVALIDAVAKTVVATIPVGKGPGFPLFSPDGSRLYLMNYGMGDIAVIDTATRQVVARHKAGAAPFGGSLLIRPR